MKIANWITLLLASLFVVLLGLAASAQADTTETLWTGASGGTWATNTNWGTYNGSTNNTVPTSSVSAVISNNTGTIALGTTAATAQGIWVTGGTATGTTTITGSGAGVLTITGTATLDSVTNAGIMLDGAGNNSLTISAPLALTNSTNFDVNNAGTLTLSSTNINLGVGNTLTLGGTNASGNIVISGATTATTGAITVNTSGTVALSGNNLNTGGVTLTAGTLIATGNAGALGAGTLSLGGGILDLTNASGTNLSFGRATTVTANIQITSDVTANGNGDTFTLGTLNIGAQTLTIAGGSHVTGGTAGVKFGVVTSTGSSTFTVNNPANGGTTLLTLASITPTAGSTLTFNGAGNTTVTGVIGATNAALVMSGTGTLTLAGADTYTGGTTISSGTVVATVGSSLGGANANVALNGGTLDLQEGTSQLTTTTNVTVGANSTILLDASGAASQTFGSTSVGAYTLTVGAGSLEAQPAVTLNTGTLTLNGNATFNINNGPSTAVTVSQTTAIPTSTYGLTKTGTGTLALSQTYHSYTGTTNINGGDLQMNYSGGTFGGNVTFGGGTLQYTSNNTVDFSSEIVNSTGAIAIDTNGQNVSYGSALASSNTAGLTKLGAGTLTFAAAEAYTGMTSVNGGTLLVQGALNGGIASVSGLTMGGGTLYLQGSNGTTPTTAYNQTLASLATTAGTSSVITINPNGQTNPNVTTLTITSPTTSIGAGSLLNFNYVGGTTNGSTLGNAYVAWNPALTNGIIGGGYTVTDAGGTGFATTNGTDVVRLADNGTSGLPTSTGSSSGNYFINQNYSTSSASTAGSLVEALSGSVTANTLTIDTTGLTSGALLGLGANTLSLGSGVIFNGVNPYAITSTGAGGINSATSGASLVFYNYATGAVTLSAPILANGTNAVTFSGPGTTVLSGANTYTGATSILSGIVNFQNSSAFGTNSSITVASGATAQVQGGITGGSKPMTISGTGALGATGALESVSGTNSYGGLLTLGAPSTISSDAGSTFNLTNTGTITGSGFGVYGLTLAGAGNGSISGVINGGTSASSGAATLVMNGTGTWILAGANTYSGRTTINSGTLQIGNGTSGSTNGTMPLTIGDATLNLYGLNTGNTSQTINTLTTLPGTNSTIEVTPHGTGNTVLSINTVASTLGAASALNFNYSAGTANGFSLGNGYVAWNAALSGGIIGTAYTVTDVGGTGYATVSGGDVIRLTGQAGLPTSTGASGTNYAINSSFSTSNTATAGSLVEALSGNVAANTVTVDTTGLASGANLSLGVNQLQIATGGGILFSGANPYAITAGTGGGITTATSAGAMTLSNYNTNTVTISAPLLANGADTVTIMGPGTTVLSGGNASTGLTTVTGGTVELSGNLAGGLTVNSGTVTAVNNGTFTVAGAATIGTNGTLSIGTGMIANFTNATPTTSGTLVLGFSGSNGTLSITGGGVVNAAQTIGSSNNVGNVINISGSGSTLNMVGLNTPYFLGTLTANLSNGGVWNVTGSTSATLTFGRGAGATATLNVGTLGATGDTTTWFDNQDASYTIQFGNSGGNGVLNLYSGKFTNPGQLAVQPGGTGTSAVNVYGGTFSQTGTTSINGATTGGQTASMNFSGGTSTLGLVNLGNSSNAAGFAYSYFNVSGGTVTETGLMTFQSTTLTGGGPGGTNGVTVSGGTLNLNAGITMGVTKGGTPAMNDYIVVNGGTLNIAGAVLMASGTGTATYTNSVNSLTVSSGSLTSTGNVTIGGSGTTTNPSVNSVTFSGGTSSFQTGVNSGNAANFDIVSGVLTQSGSSTVSMDELTMATSSASNIFTGGTLNLNQASITPNFTVSGGTLNLTNTTGQTSAGNDTFTGGLSMSSGAINISSGTTVTIGTTPGLVISGGTLTTASAINGNVNISGGSLTGSNNFANITGNATLSGTGAMSLFSNTDISGTLGITGGTPRWNGSGYVNGLATESGGVFTIGSGATFDAEAGFNITGGTIAAASSTSKIEVYGTLNYTSPSNSTFAGMIANSPNGPNSPALTMNSASTTLTLSGANTYTGTTLVEAGTLNVTGSLASGSAVTAGGFSGGGSTATLSGTGTIAGAVTTSSLNGNIGHLAPGVNTSGNFGSAGTLIISGTLTLGSGTSLDIDLNTATTLGSGVNDLIAMNGGTLTIGGAVTVNINALGTLATGSGNDYTLISGASSASLSALNLANLSATGVPAGDTAHFQVSGNNLEVYFTNSSVPAAQGFTNPLPTTLRIITGATTTVSATLSNTVASTNPLAVSLADSSTGGHGSVTSFSGTNPTTLAANSSTSVSGTFTAGSPGTGTWGITNSDPTASPTAASTGGSVTVYNHSAPALSTTTSNFGTVHAGAVVGIQTTTLSDSNAAGNVADLQITNLGGLTDSGSGLIGAGTGRSLSTTVNTNTAGSYNQVYTVSTSDDQSITGWTANGDLTFTVTGNVYSGQSVWAGMGTGGSWGTLASGFGANWGATQGSPGLDSGFTGQDTATFNDVSSHGTQLVNLDGASPNVNSLTFNAPNTSYNLAQGTGGAIKLDAALGFPTPSINVAGGSHTISAPVVVATNTNVNVASGNVLNLSGLISGSGGLAITPGTGTTILSNAMGNTYSGGTAVTNGSLHVKNTSGSATGTDGVTVSSGATLTGSGRIAPTTSNHGTGVTVNAGASLVSGDVQTANGGAVTGTGMTLDNSAGLSSILSVNGGNLTFALGTNTTSTGAYNFAAPSTNSTYITVNGNTPGEINFTLGSTASITLMDDTAGATLALRQNTPYLLISAGLGSDYANLVTAQGSGANTTYSIDGTGWVLGVATGNGTLGSAGSYIPIAINQEDINGVPLTGNQIYAAPALYLDGGNLEVVPEPGTWALMLGGLALLVFIQRRRNKLG